MSNETRKYAGLEALQTFLNNCKELFANITHKHTLSEIEDYTVDTELSSTSENPVQNKVLNAEFDSIAEGMAALELAIDVHEHSWNDLNDKPFGETSGFEITWDGNTDGIETYVEVGTVGRQYLVSEEPIPYDTLKKCTFEFTSSDGSVQSIDVGSIWDEEVSYGTVTDDVASIFEGLLAVVNKDNATLTVENTGMSYTFPKKGIYFAMYAGVYGSRLYSPSSIKQLDENYIPETIARTEYVDTQLATKADASHSHNDIYYTETEIDEKITEINASIANHEHSWDEIQNKPFDESETILEETSFTTRLVNGIIYAVMDQFELELIADNTYVVIFDGVEYLCRAATIEQSDTTITYVGNVDGSGIEPFAIGVSYASGLKTVSVTCLQDTEPTTHTLSIKAAGEKIKESCIPDTIARTTYVDENFALKSDLENIDLSSYETTANAQTKYDNAIAHSNANLESAKSYTDESVVKYELSKNGTTIILSGDDDSVTSVEESVTMATDDGSGNVVLQSMSGISYLDDSIKQELISATIAALQTETLTFTLNDGTTVTKEVVVK